MSEDWKGEHLLSAKPRPTAYDRKVEEKQARGAEMRAQREQRRERVKELLADGLTVYQTARSLGVCTSSIRADMAVIEKEDRGQA